MLLAIALVVVLTFAFSDDFTIGSWTPKKAPYREALLSSREAEMDMTDPFLPDTLELRWRRLLPILFPSLSCFSETR